MKYELVALEEIISGSLKPAHFSRQKNKAEYLKKWSLLITAEVELIKKVLVQEIFNCENENRINCYVRQHQHGIIKLLDILHSYSEKETAENAYKYSSVKVFVGIYRKILPILNQILILLRNDFKLHFDFEFKISEYNRSLLIPGIKEVISETTNILKGHAIENDLIDIIQIPFKYFLNDENQLNQKDLYYLLLYEKGIKSFLLRQNISTTAIFEMLIKLNFNEPAFTLYYIEKLKEANINLGIAGDTEFYYLQSKLINQLPLVTGIAYDPSLPSMHFQLGTWLTEEIYFLEKKQQMKFSSPATGNDQNTQPEKVQTVLSVPQLSLAIKLLLDSGIIKTRHTMEVVRMVSKSFRTSKMEQISEDSLRNKIYNVEPAAVEGMKNVIMGLWDKVREY